MTQTIVGSGRSPRSLARHGAVRPIASHRVGSACSHNNQPELDDTPRPDPMPVHVRNENLLDLNVAYVPVGGASRRLGTVSGNSAQDFPIPWNAISGQGVYLTAIPIGGSGAARTQTLNVSPGQVIEFKIGFRTAPERRDRRHDPE